MLTNNLVRSAQREFYEEAQSICPMHIASSFRYILRSVPVALFASSSTVMGLGWRVFSGRKELECKWSRLRMRALSRDRSRCRGCDTKGDEVTLRIHPIRRDASDLNGLVTLCVKCGDLANNQKLEGSSIPEFLRHLWRHIHHRGQPMQTIQSDPVHTGEVVAREKLPVSLNAAPNDFWYDGSPSGA
jgi:hypothetical protein